MKDPLNRYGSAPVGPLQYCTAIRCPHCKEELQIVWPDANEEYEKIVHFSEGEPTPMQRDLIRRSVSETMAQITEERIWNAIRSHVCSKTEAHKEKTNETS